MNKKTALITGITGQDGAYLAKFLLDKGYMVFGTFRRLSTPNFWRLQHLNILDRVSLISADLLDITSLIEAIKISKSGEIYNLAAQSFVGASFEQAIGTAEITGVGVSKILEAVRIINPDIKVYQASTSELYGNNDTRVQREDSPFNPASPYSAAKLYGHWMAKIYREAYGIFAANGILFNHESPLRGMEFVTRKISNGVAKISLGLQDKIRLGNMETRRDWGYAPEYVQSMWLMLQQDRADDYVIATNESHSVKEFAAEAFKVVGLDYRDYVEDDKKYYRPLDVNHLKGDYSKAEKKLGWRPRTRFKKIVQIMVEEDISRWKRWKKGESFPWDAPHYTSEINVATKALKI